MADWTLDQLEFNAGEKLLADLNGLFAADPDLKAVRMLWQFGGYDDSSYYGNYGFVEFDLPRYMPPSELAAEKPVLAALLWAFQTNHASDFRIFDNDSDGGTGQIIATREGYFFGASDSNHLDPAEAPDMVEFNEGKASGLYQIEIPGRTSAHERIAAIAEFRKMFPDLCEVLDAKFAEEGEA